MELLLNIEHVAYTESRLEVVDPEGFLRDVLSLLFQAAVEELLPDLQRYEAKHLLHRVYGAMRFHLDRVWHEDAAQRAFLLASLEAALGNPFKRGRPVPSRSAFATRRP